MDSKEEDFDSGQSKRRKSYWSWQDWAWYVSCYSLFFPEFSYNSVPVLWDLQNIARQRLNLAVMNTVVRCDIEGKYVWIRADKRSHHYTASAELLPCGGSHSLWNCRERKPCFEHRRRRYSPVLGSYRSLELAGFWPINPFLFFIFIEVYNKMVKKYIFRRRRLDFFWLEIVWETLESF